MKYLSFLAYFFIKFSIKYFPTKSIIFKNKLYTSNLTFFINYFFKNGLKIKNFINFNLIFLNLIQVFLFKYKFYINKFYFILNPIYEYFETFLIKKKFLFHYFCEKLNKKLYKYANYKLNRFSLKFYYVKPYLRIKKLLFLITSILLTSITAKSNAEKILIFFGSFLYTKNFVFIQNILIKFHFFIFKQFKINLFLLNKTT